MGGRRWEVGLRVGGRGRGEEVGWGRGSRGKGYVAQLNIVLCSQIPVIHIGHRLVNGVALPFEGGPMKNPPL